MKATIAGTGRIFDSIADGQLTFVRGGRQKSGLLRIDMGAGTTVTLESSDDNGGTWITDSTYSADTNKLVNLPDADAIYTLNCTVYGAATTASLSGK